MTNDSVLIAELLLEKLQELGDLSTKKMFGGHGIFINGKMFAMVDSQGRAFLKVDHGLAREFAESGSVRHSKMPYSSIPESVLNDNLQLLDWAKRSIVLVKETR